MTIEMTPELIETLAHLVAEKVMAKLPQHICQLSDDERRFLRNGHSMWRGALRTAGLAAVGAVTVAVLGWIGAMAWRTLKGP